MDNFDPEGQRFFFQMLKEWNSASFFSKLIMLLPMIIVKKFVP